MGRGLPTYDRGSQSLPLSLLPLPVSRARALALACVLAAVADLRLFASLPRVSLALLSFAAPRLSASLARLALPLSLSLPLPGHARRGAVDSPFQLLFPLTYAPYPLRNLLWLA